MSGIIIEPASSIEAIERNFARLNEAVVALQGGSIAIENIEGYENLATKLYLEEELNDVRSETQYAIGDIHISEIETNPAEKLGYGEWSLISKGRTLVGVDVAPEDDPGYEVDQDFQTPGQTGGEKEHVLTIEEMPKHSHTYRNPMASGLSGHQYTDNSGWDQTSETGGDQPHNNLQPYYCVYIWKRTA